MAQVEALKELAEKVEAGTWDMSGFMDESDFKILKDTESFTGYITELMDVVEVSSIDAAHSLHKAMLGDRWLWWVNAGSHVMLSSHTMIDTVERVKRVEASAQNNPARAWLLAIIKAKIAELEGV